MKTIAALLSAVLFCQAPSFAQSTRTINSKEVQADPYRHNELAAPLLKRIRATTDVFEKIDGISFDQAVDMYKRDLHPEKELVAWEEMTKAYLVFCKSRCTTDAERKDVYQALLLRTMYPQSEAIERAKPKVLNATEVRRVVQLYQLADKPIEVFQKK